MKKSNRLCVETIRTLGASIENMAETATGSHEDALRRLRVIRADAQRLQRIANDLNPPAR